MGLQQSVEDYFLVVKIDGVVALGRATSPSFFIAMFFRLSFKTRRVGSLSVLQKRVLVASGIAKANAHSACCLHG